MVKKLQICKSEIVPSQRFFFNDFITVLQARESCREERELEMLGVLKGTFLFCSVCVGSHFSWKSCLYGHPVRSNVWACMCMCARCSDMDHLADRVPVSNVQVCVGFSHTGKKKRCFIL